MYWVLLLQLTLVCADVITTTHGALVCVTPDDNVTCGCLDSPCVTLNSYAQNRTFDCNDTTLLFMPGTHPLTTPFMLEGTVNTTLVGSHDPPSVIIVDADVSFWNGENVSISNLTLQSTRAGMAMLSFQDSDNVMISHVMFDGMERAGGIAADNSVISFAHSLFARCASGEGGAVFAVNSMLVFGKNNHFSENTALTSGGGGMFVDSCQVSFQDLVTFRENRAASHGGAILARGHSFLSFEGSATFEHNSVMAQSNGNSDDEMANGGGALALVNGSHAVVEGLLTFDSNLAPNGGAMLVHLSNLTSHDESVMSFTNNSATWQREEGESVANCDFVTETTRISFVGKGGGIYAKSAGELRFYTVTFLDNRARYGGSVFATSTTFSIKGSFSITSSKAMCEGGGLYLNGTDLSVNGNVEIASSTARLKGSAAFLSWTDANISGETTVRDCLSSGRTNQLDGTMFLEHSKATFCGRTTFRSNSAYEGGAIYAIHSRVTLRDYSEFIENHAGLSGGGLHLEESRGTLLDEVIFHGNNATTQGGGVYVSMRSVLFLSGQALYRANHAREGGMFALENGASMILSSPFNATAIQNSAETNGGVIFYTDVISTTACATNLQHPFPVCFLELNLTLPLDLSNISISLSFVRNVAMAGSVLYGGTLTRCRLLVSETLGLEEDRCKTEKVSHYEDNPLEIITTISEITPKERSSIGSAPRRICFCENGGFNCTTSKSVRVFRGQTFKLSAITVGQASGPVPSIIRADFSHHFEINDNTQQMQSTTSACTDIFYTLLTNYSSVTLVLYPDGPCRDTGIARKEVEVELLDCPNGFSLSPDGRVCMCEDRLQLLNASCDINSGIITVSGGKWLKPIYENQTYMGLAIHLNCPFNYCVTSPINITLDNSDIICNNNRTGYLCGSCKANFSLALASFRCLECSNIYLLLLVPFGLAGIVLVLLLLALDLTIARGTLNGLILYANIVQANKAVFFPKNQQNFLTIFIAWLNLDLGIESCFFDGLTAYKHTWLQFAFPLYLWLLISLIILFSHKSRHVSKWLGTNPVAVLATLLLLSYAKVLQTIISALNRTHLDTPTGLKPIWTYDGNVDYLYSTQHKVLASVAILALLLLFLPYNLLLMFGWLLQYHSNRRLFSWITKLKPFMDTVYGPFRTGTRHWMGLLLLIRCILFLTFAFNGLSPNASSSNLLATASVFAGLAVWAWVSGRIYNAIYQDLLEAASILNITLFAAATYHVKVIQGDQALLAYISLSIAFVLFVGIVAFHVYLRVESTTYWKRLQIELRLREWFQRVKECVVGMRGKGNKRAKDGKDLELLATNQEPNNPSTSYVTLREPLLEQ